MNSKVSMKRYLLGEASPRERADLENEYLSDASLFEELTEAENDLIDSYVRGKLADHERQEFERQYLSSPHGRARVNFASAIAEISREPRQSISPRSRSFWLWLTSPFSHSSPKLRWGLAAGTVAMVVTIGWLSVRHDRGIEADLAPPAQQGGRTPSSTMAALTAGSQSHETERRAKENLPFETLLATRSLDINTFKAGPPSQLTSINLRTLNLSQQSIDRQLTEDDWSPLPYSAKPVPTRIRNIELFKAKPHIQLGFKQRRRLNLSSFDLRSWPKHDLSEFKQSSHP